MKKSLLLLVIIPLFFSCLKSHSSVDANEQDIKYYTKNSTKAGIIISSEMENKKAIILVYPEFVSESYGLIKFLTAITNNIAPTSVYLPDLPEISTEVSIIETFSKKAPQYAFNEIVDLYNFCQDMNVPITGKLEYNSDKLLILAPETKYSIIKEEVLKIYNENELLDVIMTGVNSTKDLFKVVENLPTGKKVSSAYLKEDNSKVLIILDEVKKYTPITPIVLYSVDNYLDAPTKFLESNKSIFESTHIKKMNSYLPKLIEESLKLYGEKR